jgi:hypothetical protein
MEDWETPFLLKKFCKICEIINYRKMDKYTHNLLWKLGKVLYKSDPRYGANFFNIVFSNISDDVFIWRKLCICFKIIIDDDKLYAKKILNLFMVTIDI